jgi:hypothetical protein
MNNGHEKRFGMLSRGFIRNSFGVAACVLSLERYNGQADFKLTMAAAGYITVFAGEIDHEVCDVVVCAARLGARGMECAEAKHFFARNGSKMQTALV